MITYDPPATHLQTIEIHTCVGVGETDRELSGNTHNYSMTVQVHVSHRYVLFVMNAHINCRKHFSNLVYGCVTGKRENKPYTPSARLIRKHEQAH